MQELGQYILDNAGKIVTVIVGLPAAVYIVARALHWYIDKFKSENRAYHAFRIDKLYDTLFIPQLELRASDLSCIFANHAARRLLESGNEGIYGKAWFRLIEPSELSHVKSGLREAIKEKAQYSDKVTLILPTGHVLKTVWTGEPFEYAWRIRVMLITVKMEAKQIKA